MKENVFSRSSKVKEVFKNEKYLYPEFVPERLPHRDSEIDSLVYAFNPVTEGKRPLNVFVFGPTGTGKTVCAKFVLNELEEYSDRAKFLYLNCFEFNSRHAVLAALSNFVGEAISRRGTATDEVFSVLLEGLKNIDFAPILVLDEIDQLVFREEASALLYDLLRIVEYQKNFFGIIFISNNPEIVSALDDRVRSSLMLEQIEFRPYSPQQLKDILRERCDHAFLPNALDKEVINVAAAHAAKFGGDARIAIESLLKAGRIAEKENSEKVLLKHLRSAFASTTVGKAEKIIKQLGRTEQILLKFIAENEWIYSGKLFEKYCASVKTPLSERRIRDFIKGLEKQNLVETALIDFGNKGKTRKISLKVPSKAVFNALL